MAYLSKTTFAELAYFIDEAEIGDNVVFTTEDPDELEFYGLRPSQFNVLRKIKLLDESDYVVMIGRLDGNTTIAKDIYIISNRNPDDEDSRLEGLEDFIEEYYNEYMEKNKADAIYLMMEWWK